MTTKTKPANVPALIGEYFAAKIAAKGPFPDGNIPDELTDRLTDAEVAVMECVDPHPDLLRLQADIYEELTKTEHWCVHHAMLRNTRALADLFRQGAGWVRTGTYRYPATGERVAIFEDLSGEFQNAVLDLEAGVDGLADGLSLLANAYSNAPVEGREFAGISYLIPKLLGDAEALRTAYDCALEKAKPATAPREAA